MLNKKDVIKIVEIAATLIGVGATILSSWADDRKMEIEIEKKVNEALSNHFKN